MAAIHRTEDLALEALDTAAAPGGSGESIKLAVLSETEPYVHVTEVSPGYVIHPHSHSESEVTIVLSGSARIGDRVCGAGTILIERGEYGRYAQLLGGDIRPEAIAATRTNIGPRYKPIAVREWDAGSLPLANDSVDRVACNLPFGKKVGEPWELRSLYQRFASELERVLRGGGVAVLLTSERKLLEEALALLQTLYIERLLPIEVLGQKAFVLKLKKVI